MAEIKENNSFSKTPKQDVLYSLFTIEFNFLTTVNIVTSFQSDYILIERMNVSKKDFFN